MWIQIDNGETIGTVGSECGEIIEDDEHPRILTDIYGHSRYVKQNNSGGVE
ncbi:hypothetical protein [Pseudoalteromonas citrea]|uniref:hypothetical protein n=1 Tax=Pseudoalteromonas citrea TaxID=43655 RepID=UPI0014867248|nr:hypothetical protein [Pseudoalteromonas citrea]